MTDETIRENRLRRMAERQGLRLTKVRPRDPGVIEHGIYTLERDQSHAVEPPRSDIPWGTPLSLDEVEALLKGGRI